MQQESEHRSERVIGDVPSVSDDVMLSDDVMPPPETSASVGEAVYRPRGSTDLVGDGVATAPIYCANRRPTKK